MQLCVQPGVLPTSGVRIESVSRSHSCLEFLEDFTMLPRVHRGKRIEAKTGVS